MDLIVIHNPNAGGANREEKYVARLLEDAGHNVRITSRKKCWVDAMAETPDAFVAAGGDGTVHKVIRALAGRSVPLAILPLGTANNVAQSLGYRSSDDLTQRVAAWQQNEQTLQLARVQCGGREECLIEAAGWGAFAAMVSKSSDGGAKSHAAVALLNMRLALVKKLLRTRPVAVRATIGTKTVEGEYLLLECLNLPFYGPRLRLAPDETAAAPQLTLCGISPAAADAAAEWMSTGDGEPRLWTLGSGSTIEIVADKAAHVDGIPWPNKELPGPLRIQGGVQSVRVWV